MQTRGTQQSPLLRLRRGSRRCSTSGLPQRVPLHDGPFLLEAVGIGLGDLTLRVGRNSPLLVQGALPADLVWAVLPLSSDRPVLLNGRSAGPHAMAIYGAGALHEGANHAEARWAFLTLQAAAAERLCDLPSRSPLFRPGAHAVLACDPEVWHRAARLLRSAAEVAVQDPEVFEVAEARRSLRSSVPEMLQDLTTGAWGGERPRFLRSSPERQRIVRAIEDYLQAYPGQAPTAEEVATALGVSAPRLRRAIRASFGISLQRYLLLRRLTLFRIALRSAGPRRPLPEGDRAGSWVLAFRPPGAGLPGRVPAGPGWASRRERNVAAARHPGAPGRGRVAPGGICPRPRRSDEALTDAGMPHM